MEAAFLMLMLVLSAIVIWSNLRVLNTGFELRDDHIAVTTFGMDHRLIKYKDLESTELLSKDEVRATIEAGKPVVYFTHGSLLASNCVLLSLHNGGGSVVLYLKDPAEFHDQLKRRLAAGN